MMPHSVYLLAKSLNIAPTPKRIPYEDIVSSIEEMIILNKIPTLDAETLRQDVAVILRESKPPKSNITAEEQLAQRNLQGNADILLLRADKDNTTVVMNTTDYDDKMRELLKDTVYKPVPYNPTARMNKPRSRYREESA